MKLNRWVVAGTAAAFVLVPGAAMAAPDGATNDQSFADAAADAPPTVDLTNVEVYRVAGTYRATVKFTGLRPQNGNRYYVSFADISDNTSTTVNGNLVEFRRTPGGQEKTLSFKTTDGANAVPTTCGGVRATPDYSDKSKITFVIPDACWKGTNGASRVTAGARHYPTGTFETTSNPPQTNNEKSDFLDESGAWFYGTSSGPM